MVKHGRDRKRRAGRTGRTKLKKPSWNRWDPSPKISDGIIRRHWDASKSPAANLKIMGLIAKPNERPGSADALSATASCGEDVPNLKPCIVDLYDVPESDVPKMKAFPLDKNEEEYIVKCMTKYGTDYKAMFRDIKTNRLQHTEAKLKKMGARYLLLTPEQRRVEVPERLKDALAFSDEVS